jgi:hypothetical protein
MINIEITNAQKKQLKKIVPKLFFLKQDEYIVKIKVVKKQKRTLYKHTCQCCKKKFETNIKTSVYCNLKCYWIGRKGKKRYE